MTRVPWREWTWSLEPRQAAEQGDRRFVRFEHGQDFTFRSLDAWTDGLAGSLAALGVRAGDRVLGLLGNRAESIGMLFASAKLGAVWVPVNTGLRGAFLQHQLDNAEPRVVVVEDRLASNLSDVVAARWVPEAMVIVGDPAAPIPRACAPPGASRSPSCARSAPAGFASRLPPGDVAMTMYTSGTTGRRRASSYPMGTAICRPRSAEAIALTAATATSSACPLPRQRPLAVPGQSHRRGGGR
jgi:crotonobetaine/carnitine-CoA ligase